jgi:uncharacterized protein YukE
MAASDEVRVDPPILETAARVSGEIRDRLQQAGGDAAPATEAAIAGLSGWQTRQALEDLLWAWNDDTAALGKYLGTLGDALTGCARDYQHTDRANAGLFDIRGR